MENKTKMLFAFTLAALAVVTCVFIMFDDEDSVAVDTTSVSTIDEFLSAIAQDDFNIVLAASFSTESQITIERSGIIDFNKNTISTSYVTQNGATGDAKFSLILKGNVTLKNGTYKGPTSDSNDTRGVVSYGNLTIEKMVIDAKGINVCQYGGEKVVKISGSTISGSYAVCTFNNKIIVAIDDSKLTGTVCGLYHNGSYYGYQATVSNTTISSNDDGIYVSGSTTTTSNNGGKNQQLILNNCKITGGTGVEGKFTDITLNDCEVISTANEVSFEQYNNGSTTAGFAVVSTDNTMEPNVPKLTAKVAINGGIYKGLIGLSSFYLCHTTEEKLPDNFQEATYEINGGSFTDLKSAVEYATSGATITLAENVTLNSSVVKLAGDVTVTLKSDVTLNDVKFVGKHALTITSEAGKHFTLTVNYDFKTDTNETAGEIFEVSNFVLDGANLKVIQKDTGKTEGPKNNQAGCSVFGTGSVEVKGTSTMTITTNEFANRVFYNNGSSLKIDGPTAKVILEKASSSTVSLSMTDGATLEIKNPLKTAGNFYPNIDNTGKECKITVTGAANGNHGLFFYGSTSNAKDAAPGVLKNCIVKTDGIVGFYSHQSVDATGSTFEAKELVVAKSSAAEMANVKGATFNVAKVGALNPNDEYKPINDKELYLDGVTFNGNTVIDSGVRTNGMVTLAKGAELTIAKDSTFTGTINGPGNNKLVANGMKAGEGGITITGGSLIINGKIMNAGGSEAGATVTVTGNAIKVEGTLESGATMVIEEGTVVTVEDGKTFSSNGTVNNNGIIDNKGTITNDGVLTNNGTIKMTGASEINTNVENNKVVNNGVVVDERAEDKTAVPVTNNGTVVAKNNADKYKDAKVDVIVQDPETAKKTDGTVIVDENKFIFIDAITTTGKLNIIMNDGYKQYTVTIPEGTSIAAGTVISVSFIEYQSDSVTRYQINTPGIENFSMKLPCQIGFKKAKVYCDDSELGVSKVRYDAGTGYVTFDASHNSVFTIVLSNTSHAGTTTVSGGDTTNDYSLVIAFVVLVASLGFLAYVIKRR